MPAQLPMFSWVEPHQNQIGFGVQAVAHASDPEPNSSLVETGILAERLGFDAYFIGDHPAYHPDAWLHLTAVASRTRRIRLGSVVNCVLYRDPVMLARLASDFDHLSDGRLILGVGIGWNEGEFGQLGLRFPSIKERQEILEETLTIVDGVWGPEPFTFHGKHVSTTGGHVAPPRQQPRPPLMIAGGGERVTLRQVAERADACNFGSGSNVGGAASLDAVRQKLTVLRHHCEAVGRPYDAILRTHFTTWLMLAKTDRAAQAKLNRYYPDGLTPEQRLTRVVGTPERIVPYFQALVDVGMQYFVVQIMDATDHETFELLAREVAPHVKPRAAVPAE